MTFYPWLEPNWQRLLQLFKQQRVPHALLFYGPKGLGKTLLAQAFEQLLLCQTPSAIGACQQCRSCFLYQQQHHPDSLHKGGEEAIGIDDIREVSHFLDQTSHQKGKKVVTLFDVDKLQPGSANALLKTLEEPQGDAVLILVASHSNIIPTLKSRCFLVNIPLPPRNSVLTWLSQSLPLRTPQECQQGLFLAGGSPLLAKEIIGSELQGHVTWCSALLEGTTRAFDSEEIQQLITSQPLTALYLLYYWLVDFMRYDLQCQTGFSYNDEQLKHLRHLLGKVSLAQIFTYLENVNEAIRALSSPSINKQLLFESLFCQWHSLCHQGKLA